MISIIEIIRNVAEVNHDVTSLLNVQPSKPIQPPPQFAGAMVTQIADKIINGIANFFQKLKICSFKKRKMKEIEMKEIEYINNGVPTTS